MGKKEKKLKVDEFADSLEVGRIYRLSELKEMSDAVNRHVQELVKLGILKRLRPGIYIRRAKTTEGWPTPHEGELIKAFLRDDRFLLITSATYKDVGLPTPIILRLNKVYNHKRHGKLRLDGVAYNFHVKPYFPLKATKEFLLVDAINTPVGSRATREKYVLEHARKGDKLAEAVRLYAGPTARNFFKKMLGKKSGS